MTTIRCVVALDPARLLLRATETMFPLAPSTTANPWPTLPAWMVLRQGGLRDDLHALAASAGVAGWFDPPVCLFAELSTRWHDDGSTPLSAQDRTALLSSLLAKHGRAVFGKSGGVESWVPAVDRFIGDLIGEGVSIDSLRHAMESRTGRDTFERDRDTALVSIYSAWVSELARLGRTDGRDSRVRLAAAITADSATFAERLGGRRDIRIVGLADLRGGWSQLLSALASSPAVDSVTVYASHAIAFPPSLDVETIVDKASNETTASARRLFMEAPDAAREVEIVATRVRALVDAGVAPHRIAVAARQARPLVDEVSIALDTLGVPVTARRRISLAHTGPARALRALLAAPAEGWTRHGVLELAEHPLLSLGLDAAVLNFVGTESPLGSIDAWTAALTALLARARRREQRADDGSIEIHDRGRALPASVRIESTLAAWKAFIPAANHLHAERSASAWFAWAQEVLTSDSWGIARQLATAPAGDQYVLRTDSKARDRIASLVGEWRRALETFGDGSEAPINAERFSAQLTLALGEDLIVQPETSFGVVVGEALSVGWRSFEHVFVVGLASGEFPRRMPVSPLLSERDRNGLIAAGIPLDPSSAWRERERELFRVLSAAPTQSLTLSWPAMDAEGRETARSSFVDECIDAARAAHGVEKEDALEAAGVLSCIPPEQTITRGFPIVSRVATTSAIDHAVRVAAIERDRLRTISPYNGAIVDAALLADIEQRYGAHYVWSATSIEELAKCPYSWMANRLLRLEGRGEPDDAIEPFVTGRILHSALQRFFDSEHARIGGPVYLTSADTADVRVRMSDALDAAWNSEGATSWLGVPAMRPLVKAELLGQLHAYLDFEIEDNDDRTNNRTKSSKRIHTGATRAEVEFKNVTITSGTSSFLLRGTIDRVDSSHDDRITDGITYVAAIDYKSSKGSTPAGGSTKGWDDGVVLQVPLYAEVVRQTMPGTELARLEYRTLRKPEIVHQLQFKKVEGAGKPGKKTFSVIDDEEAPEKFTGALASAAQRVEQARRGEFPASPARSCGCSPFCAARDVCRIPNGPVSISKWSRR